MSLVTSEKSLVTSHDYSIGANNSSQLFLRIRKGRKGRSPWKVIYFLLSPNFQDPRLLRTHHACLHYSMESKQCLHHYPVTFRSLNNSPFLQSPSFHSAIFLQDPRSSSWRTSIYTPVSQNFNLIIFTMLIFSHWFPLRECFCLISSNTLQITWRESVSISVVTHPSHITTALNEGFSHQGHLIYRRPLSTN